MPSTTNFGWTTPADTDLVKDGAAAIRTLGNGVDASFVDLKGGTTGQVLAKNSDTDLDFVWTAATSGDITAVTAGTGLSGGGTSGAVTLTNDMATTITASGDIVVGTGSGTYDNLPIGTTGQVLTADTTVSPYKVKWASASAPAFVGCSVYRGSILSIGNNTTVTINFEDELIDTDGYHSNTTNPSRLTIPSGKAGKYLVISNLILNSAGGSGACYIQLRKNGTTTMAMFEQDNWVNSSACLSNSQILELSVGDYLEMRCYQNSGTSKNVEFGEYATYFKIQYLGA